MRGKIIVGLMALTVVVIVVAFQTRQNSPVQKPRPAVASQGSSSASAPAETEQAPASQALAAEENALMASSDPQFQQWIRTEAKSLDEPNVDGPQKAVQIRAMVAKITPSQSRQLRQTVNSPRALAREKILSAYLLVEGGLKTRQDLKDSISAPLNEKGGEAHSEEEIKGVREKSLRIMMIDGLYSQAKTDPQARATLAQAIQDSEDPYIKAYAQQKLDQLLQR